MIKSAVLSAAMLFCAAASADDAADAGLPADAGRWKIAALGFELSDRSLEGELRGANDAEIRRLQLLSKQMEDALAASPLFALARPPPARVNELRPFRACNACEIQIAREVGARLAIYGVVEKISNLILDIRLVVVDARDGRMLFAERVGIRGNNDRAWQNGLRYLLENRLLPQ